MINDITPTTILRMGNICAEFFSELMKIEKIEWWPEEFMAARLSPDIILTVLFKWGDFRVRKTFTIRVDDNGKGTVISMVYANKDKGGSYAE